MHDQREGGRNAEPREARKDREENLRDAVLAEPSEELRPNFVADREEKQHEGKRFERTADGDVELPNEHARQQRRRHVPEMKTFHAQRPDQIAE